MKRIITILALAAVTLIAGSCLKIETNDTEHKALCMPFDGVKAVDLTDPHAYTVTNTELPPALHVYTDGRSETAVYNPVYDPAVTGRDDSRHYEFILTIPQPGGDAVYLLNWPDTYR